MRIQILSDLHLEHRRHYGFNWNIPDSDADIVVLAGDIDVGIHGVVWAAEQAERLGKDILYVPGNHEYWGEDLYELPKALRTAIKGSRVTLLDNDEVIIGDTRFIGGTLWTNLGDGELMDVSLGNINDHRKISAKRWWNNARNRQRALRHWWDIDKLTGSFLPEVALEQHRKCLHFIRARLDTPFDGRTVIVTHHAPTWESLRRSGISEYNLNRDRWPNLRFSSDSELFRVAGYASNLDALLLKYRDVVDVWIHGHIHNTLDYAHHGIRIISNPHGYLSKYKEGLQPQVSSFDPLHLVDPAEGIAPVLAREFIEPLAQLDEILAEAQAHAPYAANVDSKVANMTGYYLQRLAVKFNTQMRLIVAPLLIHLLDMQVTPADHILDYQPFAFDWHELFGKRISLAVDVHFRPSDDDGPSYADASPAAYATVVLKSMTALNTLMHERLPLVLAGERYTQLRAIGFGRRGSNEDEDEDSEW